MGRPTGDVVGAHAAFGSPPAVIEQRRAVYQLSVELLTGGGTRLDDPDVLDNPMLRGHLGKVLSGDDGYWPGALRPLADLVVAPVTLAGHPVRVAGAPLAPAELVGALRRVEAELARHGGDAAPLVVLTVEHASFEPAYAQLLAGVELALRVAPELAADLLPHVALFALLGQGRHGLLGSASVREYPGLVLLPEPASALEAAEALVHEGAHQKFFDLAIVRSIFGPDQYEAPGFGPSWGVEVWPLEQTFAACHAYHCLAVFAERLVGRPEIEPGGLSLLPMAAERAAEIGCWLWSHQRFLANDGRVLLASLLGEPPPPVASASGVVPIDGPMVVRRFGHRTLTARRSDPVDLFWH